MKLILVTGVSGAGKSTVVQAFEEMDYRIVENVPLSIIPELLNAFVADPKQYEKTVLVIPLGEAKKALPIIRKKNNISSFFLVLDASKAEILTRYKLTRHIHPLQAKGLSLEDAIEKDRKNVDLIRPQADLFIDTTGLSTTELRRRIFVNFNGLEKGLLTITIVSFGYKHGLPDDAEIVFDTRILDNPYWVSELQHLTGKDKPVQDYVLKSKYAKELINGMENYLDKYLSIVKEGGRNFFTIGIGCSGGQHRSVTIAEILAKYFEKKYSVVLIHRDAERFKI